MSTLEYLNAFLEKQFRPHCTLFSGILFGIGWAIWADAVTLSAVHGNGFNWVALVPGLVATLAIITMNCVSRGELTDTIYGDEEGICRARLTLFVSYVFAVAAIASAVGVLLSSKASGETDLWLGAASILQSCLVVGSGLVAWFFRESDSDNGYSYMY